MDVLVVTSKAPPEYSGSGNRVLSQYLRLEKRVKVNFNYVSSSTEKHLSLPKTKNIFGNRISFKPFSYFLGLNVSKAPKILKYLEFIVEFYICYFYLKKIVRHFDVIHIVGDVALTTAAIVISEKKGIKYIYEIVNEDKNKTDPLWLRIPPFIKRPTFDKNNSSIKTINYKTKQHILMLHENTKVYYYPNSVNVDQVRKLTKVGANLSVQKKRIINIAKFIPRKNQNLLIEAMSHLSNDYSLVLMGPMSNIGINKDRDEEYLASLFRLTNNLNLSERVSIKVGFVEEPLEVIYDYNVFVYPSVHEAFGTTLVEASMLCVPVVASASEPAFQDFVKSGVNGYLFDGTARDLAQKIESAIILDREELSIFRNKLMDKLSHKKSDENLLKMLSETCKA